MNEQKKSVLITGASTGIGAACAQRLASLGFEVFAGVRRREDGEALQQRCTSPVVPVILDVTEQESIRVASATIAEAVQGRGLAGLVNNAGIAVAAPIELVPLEQLRRQLEINLIGQVAVTQAFLPMLRTAMPGRIVNMSSIAGRTSMPLLGPYCASKFALEAMSDALRLELQQWGIHVSVVEPGAIDTPIWDKSGSEANEFERTTPPEKMQLYAHTTSAVRGRVATAASRAIPASAVAAAVVHALTAPIPKTRYLVGTDAKVQAFMKWLLPDRWSDALLTRLLGLPHSG
jgi:NAD(P)-dependent dehydrogenase (short-subunit alcohol dehydrogenase family)